MSNLLLTSAGFENPKIGEEFLRLINKPASDIKILFIPTAAITKEQMKYVDESKFELLELGILEDNIFKFNLDYQIAYDEVKNVDAIYICGGSTLHLLNKIKEIQFDIVIKKLINDSKLYVGVSAGSIVLGPKVKDQSGLNIVDTIIMPHYCDEFHEKLVTMRMQTEFSITPLTDSQALLVSEMKYQIIE